jgi:hypothetical protein
VLAHGASVRGDVEDRLRKVQDRVRVMEEDFKFQAEPKRDSGWDGGTANGNPGGGTLPCECCGICNQVQSPHMHHVLGRAFGDGVCMRSKGETGKEQSERKHAAQKANVHSALEADLVASMGHERPLCLCSKDKKELATHNKGFAACPSHKTWSISGGMQSFWCQLDCDFEALCKGLMGLILTQGRALSTGDLLAQCLVTALQGHWVKLIAFINSFFRELVLDVAKFREEKAWVLVGQCVACIEDPTSVRNKSVFIWSVFQLQRVMEEFIVFGFKGHPSIVKEMSLFMVTERVDPSEILGMMSKVSKAEAAAERATAESKRLTKANAAQKRRIDAIL